MSKLLEYNLDNTRPQPPGWSNDELTRFLQIATENGYATYVQEKVYWPQLQKIDALFYHLSQNIDNSREWFYALFFLRAHSIWRAAVRLVISGQNPETHILLRACLEQGMYAFFIYNDKLPSKNISSRFMIWMQRETSGKAEKICRDTFTAGQMKRELMATDRQLGKIAAKIYDQSISHGAHPNVHGTLGNISLSEDGQTHRIETQYMNTETAAFQFANKRTCQTGLCILLMFKIIFKERFDILGVSDVIDKLKSKL